MAENADAEVVEKSKKKMGYNAAQELYRRVQANITRQSDEDDE